MACVGPSSVLVVGASGRLGVHILRYLINHHPKPHVYAFCRNPCKLTDRFCSLCASVIQGNARSVDDIEGALHKSKADVVVICIGNGDCVTKTDVREASGRALTHVLQKPEFDHVQVYVVSSTGAGDSQIILSGFTVGIVLLENYLRHVLKDHTKQEQAFEPLMERTVIVRPTALTENLAAGMVMEFTDDCDDSFRIHVDRDDVAAWIVQDMYSPSKGGRVVKLTAKTDIQ